MRTSERSEGELEWWYGAEEGEGVEITAEGLFKLFVNGRLTAADWIRHRQWALPVSVEELIEKPGVRRPERSPSQAANAWAAVAVTGVVVLLGVVMLHRDRVGRVVAQVEVEPGSVEVFVPPGGEVQVGGDGQAPQDERATVSPVDEVVGSGAQLVALSEASAAAAATDASARLIDDVVQGVEVSERESEADGSVEKLDVVVTAESDFAEPEAFVEVVGDDVQPVPTGAATRLHLEWMHEALWGYLESAASFKAEVPGLTSVELVARRCALLEEAVERARYPGVDPALVEVHTQVLSTAQSMHAELKDAAAAYRDMCARYGRRHRMVSDEIAHRRKRLFVDQLKSAEVEAARWSAVQTELPGRYPEEAEALGKLLGAPCFATAEGALRRVPFEAVGQPSGEATLAMYQEREGIRAFDYVSEVNSALSGWAIIIFPESWVTVQAMQLGVARMKGIDLEGVDGDVLPSMAEFVAISEEALRLAQFEHHLIFAAEEEFTNRHGAVQFMAGFSGQMARKERANRLLKEVSRQQAEERACLRQMARRYPAQSIGFLRLLGE